MVVVPEIRLMKLTSYGEQAAWATRRRAAEGCAVVELLGQRRDERRKAVWQWSCLAVQRRAAMADVLGLFGRNRETEPRFQVTELSVLRSSVSTSVLVLWKPNFFKKPKKPTWTTNRMPTPKCGYLKIIRKFHLSHACFSDQLDLHLKTLWQLKTMLCTQLGGLRKRINEPDDKSVTHCCLPHRAHNQLRGNPEYRHHVYIQKDYSKCCAGYPSLSGAQTLDIITCPSKTLEPWGIININNITCSAYKIEEGPHVRTKNPTYLLLISL